MKKIAAVLALVALASPATAAPRSTAFTIDGDRLLKLCTGETEAERQACFGYVTGVQDTVVTSEMNQLLPRFCVPKGTRVGAIKDAVVSYLQSNEKERGRPGAEMVIDALTDSFACR